MKTLSALQSPYNVRRFQVSHPDGRVWIVLAHVSTAAIGIVTQEEMLRDAEACLLTAAQV